MIKHRMLVAGFAAALFVAATPSLAAEITVDSATMVDGRLVVSGHAAANATITIVGTDISSWTGMTGYFLVGGSYSPPTCTISLTDGTTTTDVIAVDNCDA